jgi:hypothetical protein
MDYLLLFVSPGCLLPGTQLWKSAGASEKQSFVDD